jgi:osmoprotectant transport system substrate-binding protein
VTRRTWILLSAVALGVTTAACGGAGLTPAPASGPAITIGSLGTTVSVITAALYADVLTHAGAEVTLRTGSGSGSGRRASVEPALASGQLDLYPDDAGALLLFLDADDTTAATATSTAVPALKRLLEPARVTVLDPAPDLDTDVFAVTRATADADHLTTLSSLRPVAAKLVLGGPPGCPGEAQCQMGLEATYGLHFKSFTSLDDAGPITVAALKGGEVQVAPLSSDDGSVLGNGFVALVDDKHLLDADNLVPVIRTAVDTGPVRDALDRLSAQLTTDQMSELSIEVNQDHEAPGTAARRWLVQHHLI